MNPSFLLLFLSLRVCTRVPLSFKLCTFNWMQSVWRKKIRRRFRKWFECTKRDPFLWIPNSLLFEVRSVPASSVKCISRRFLLELLSPLLASRLLIRHRLMCHAMHPLPFNSTRRQIITPRITTSLITYKWQ